MRRSVDRLRLRLAVLASVGIVTPLLVLLAVAAWTTEEVRTFDDGTTITDTGSLSAWIPATVAVLVIPSAIAAWWWAGREVRDQARAMRAVEEQRRLIEDVSHRLRTPIAVLLTNADVTLAEPHASEADLRHALTASRTTAANMQGLVEDLLADARSRRLESDRSSTNLAAIVAGVCRSHADSARAKQVTIRRTGPAHVAVAVDGGALERAVEAIVDNAVRHAPTGSDVRVGIATTDSSCVIEVVDDGPGIDPDHQALIFERYWTTDPGRNGIGLAIAAEAARDAFSIGVDSPLGPHGGTRLTLSIPHRAGR
jgi:signal transduction histidine kinase